MRSHPIYTAALRALALLMTLAPAAASAIDGVSEINQTCAVLTGCFTGDTAGFPVTITTQGSYRLTSNLVVPDEDTTGILYSVSNVAIDLNHFGIIRSDCQSNASCPAFFGAGSGIRTSSATNTRTTVQNGDITGMGSGGLVLGSNAQVMRMRITRSGGTGITAQSDALIDQNTVSVSFGNGIAVTFRSTVSNNRVSSSGLGGISATNNGLISGNVVQTSGSHGISADDGASISNNTVTSSQQSGIEVGAASTVFHNISRNNALHGISAGTASNVFGNTVYINSGYGLNLSSNTAYRDNMISSNFQGSVMNGINLLGNACGGNTSCP
ncbi:MAG: right-handed parallel beta-helix repeat-containing protein [Myxococcota bacterium]